MPQKHGEYLPEIGLQGTVRCSVGTDGGVQNQIATVQAQVAGEHALATRAQAQDSVHKFRP